MVEINEFTRILNDFSMSQSYSCIAHLMLSDKVPLVTFVYLDVLNFQYFTDVKMHKSEKLLEINEVSFFK